MNATLEGMAQALFQSWFVDFDPVIDKALAAGNPIPEPLQARAAVRESLATPASLCLRAYRGFSPMPLSIQTKWTGADGVGGAAALRRSELHQRGRVP